MKIKRVRGDTYPIEVNLKINGEAVILGDADIVTFNYTSPSGIKTINGVKDDTVVGKVRFTPTSTDFVEAGDFKYDIRRVVGERVTTHLLSQLIIEQDIS